MITYVPNSPIKKDERLFGGLTCAAVLLILLSSSIAATEAAAPQFPLEDIQARIRSLTPSYKAPNINLFDSPGEETLLFRLLGVDLAQDGKPISQEAPALDGNRPLEITGYWMPILEPTTSTIPLSLRFTSPGGRISREFKKDAGPASSESPWLPGSVYKQTHIIPLQELSVQLNGEMSMQVDVRAKGKGTITLQLLQVYVSPRTGSGKVAADSLTQAFGAEHRDLSVSFRLGYSSSNKITIPLEFRKNNSSLAIVSAFSYGSIPQDKSVCMVTAEGSAGRKHTWELMSGVDTARSDYDYDEKSQRHKKVDVVESQHADYLNSDGRRFMRHKYKCILEIPDELMEIETLTFRSTNKHQFDVHDVLLLP